VRLLHAPSGGRQAQTVILNMAVRLPVRTLYAVFQRMLKIRMVLHAQHAACPCAPAVRAACAGPSVCRRWFSLAQLVLQLPRRHCWHMLRTVGIWRATLGLRRAGAYAPNSSLSTGFTSFCATCYGLFMPGACPLSLIRLCCPGARYYAVVHIWRVRHGARCRLKRHDTSHRGVSTRVYSRRDEYWCRIIVAAAAMPP